MKKFTPSDKNDSKVYQEFYDSVSNCWLVNAILLEFDTLMNEYL